MSVGLLRYRTEFFASVILNADGAQSSSAF
jgi:hypothetical protein